MKAQQMELANALQSYKQIVNCISRLSIMASIHGKGAALRTGLKPATGEICFVQEADLEYDPQEFPVTIKPIFMNNADMVFGSRFQSGRHESLPTSG